MIDLRDDIDVCPYLQYIYDHHPCVIYAQYTLANVKKLHDLHLGGINGDFTSCSTCVPRPSFHFSSTDLRSMWISASFNSSSPSSHCDPFCDPGENTNGISASANSFGHSEVIIFAPSSYIFASGSKARRFRQFFTFLGRGFMNILWVDHQHSIDLRGYFSSVSWRSRIAGEL